VVVVGGGCREGGRGRERESESESESERERKREREREREREIRGYFLIFMSAYNDVVYMRTCMCGHAWHARSLSHTQPLEYCILLTDVESISDLEALTDWRQFVNDETGIELNIKA
jgi:hypothetical protein